MPEVRRDPAWSTPLAANVAARLSEVFPAAADPVRAVAMRSYMRDQFPFLGIAAPLVRQLSRQVLAGLPGPTEADLAAVALGCWRLPEREYQYFACAWLRRHIAVCGPGFLPTVEQLIVTRSWWDTVDALAAHVVGPLVARHPPLVSTMDEWAASENLWLARTALLHQLTFAAGTDQARLFGYCGQLAGHRDFFIRKAIGWALRQYAKTDPDAVRRYVLAHRASLSALSVREALRAR
ncbi:MAG TPA: DNA alkylation repair protein [Micromonosporaceae bacterium]